MDIQRMPPKVLNNNNETDLHFKMRRVAKIYNIMLCLSLSLFHSLLLLSLCALESFPQQ